MLEWLAATLRSYPEIRTFFGLQTQHRDVANFFRVYAPFAKLGPRRTQNLRGGVSQTAPFHWDGEFKDLSGLMGDVFAKRMSGGCDNSKPRVRSSPR